VSRLVKEPPASLRSAAPLNKGAEREPRGPREMHKFLPPLFKGGGRPKV